MSTKRMEVLMMKYIKIILVCLYACLVSLVYIIREIVDLILPEQGKSLAGQNVLVTGAGRGLGREICLRLVNEGVKVFCLDLSLDLAKETAAICNASRPGCAFAYYCDVADRQQVTKLVDQLPPIDILINNAGIVSCDSVLDVTDEHIDRVMQVNVLAHFWTVRAFLPGMIARGKGHIVAMASVASFTEVANIALYSASKYAVLGFMSSLREELRHSNPGIKTTTIHPFFIAPPKSSEDHWDKKCRLPDVTATDVAERTVWGIKREKLSVTIPPMLYFTLLLLKSLPAAAGDYWKDIFYAKLKPIPKKTANAS